MNLEVIDLDGNEIMPFRELRSRLPGNEILPCCHGPIAQNRHLLALKIVYSKDYFRTLVNTILYFNSFWKGLGKAE